MNTASLPAKALLVYDGLIAAYGERPLVPRREPMHELISTMLSHRTTNANEAQAYERMMTRFKTWEGVRDAPVEALIESISPATFPEVKAPNIQKTLATIISERGEANIDFLKDWPVDEGVKWLTDLPGVGIKTATLVLLFCFSKPVLPVDTHVHRISKRLGLIGDKVSADVAHRLLLDMLPNDAYILFNFHKAMLRHGQTLCTFNAPRCERCPLRAQCDYYQRIKVLF